MDGEADLVVASRIEEHRIVDHDIADIACDDVGIHSAAAGDERLVAVQVENVYVVSARDFAGSGNQRLARHAQRHRHLDQVESRLGAFVAVDDVLDKERVVVVQKAFAAIEIADNFVEELLPVRQPADRVGDNRRALDQRFKHPAELAGRIGRMELARRHVIGDLGKMHR